MKVTYNWLKDYVDIKDSPEELARLLTMAGLEVTSLKKLGNDTVFELEITPNRPDCLSVIGIAREVAAITGKKLKVPPLNVRDFSSKKPISIEIKDTKLCPRYSGRMIEGVEVSASPSWVQERLKALELRPVNNIVDVTNFCLFETGQPMHAFDSDKLKGSRIIVRRAGEGEGITTIDGVERKLSPDMLIIADEERPIAIAGVMGGIDTEVGSSTKNILLESAYFDPISVRLTSRKLGLGSESSYRFERSVDIDSVVSSSNRAALLINGLAAGQIQGLVDKGKKKAKPKTISYNVKETSKFLGVSISGSVAKGIFKALGLKVTGSGNSLKVNIPSFRQDLNSTIDLVEEVARIYGYDKVPSTIPEMVRQRMRKDLSRIVQEKAREVLVASGLTEIVTYSLLNKDSLKKLSLEKGSVIDIVNPLSTEQESMRPTILIGMLNAVLWNLNRRIEGLKLFELGNVYFKDKEDFKENLSLAIALTGSMSGSWRRKRTADFFDIKGTIEGLLHRLGIKDIVFLRKEAPYFSPAQSASLQVKGSAAGMVGKVKKEILSNFGIKQDVYVAELNIDKLLSFIKLKKHFEPIPKFPSTKRDISIILDRNVPSSEIISSIKETGIPSIVDVEVFDEYYGEQIPKDKRGLSFSIIYQDNSKTFTDEEVDQFHAKVKEALTQKFSAQFR